MSLKFEYEDILDSILFKFTIQHEKSRTIINLCNNVEKYTKKWQKLIDSIEAKENYTIEYCLKDGHTELRVEDNYLKFGISKTSEDKNKREVDIAETYVEIELDECKNVLIEALNAFKNYHTRQEFGEFISNFVN